MKLFLRVSTFLLIFSFIFPLHTTQSATDQQISEVDIKVQELMDKMTPEEKLVNFFWWHLTVGK